MANIVSRKKRGAGPLTFQKLATKMAEDFIVSFQERREISRARQVPVSAVAMAAFDDVVEKIAGIRPIEMQRRLHPQSPSRNGEKPSVRHQENFSKKTARSPGSPNPFIDEETQRLKDFVDGKRSR